MNTKRIATWTFLALLLPALAGCIEAAVVGIGAGAMMATDRRPSDTYLTDQVIELRAGNGIGEKYPNTVHVNITSYNRLVLITGEVPDAATKTDIEKIVSSKPNVKSTQNELRISGISSLGSRGNDALITGKVKARFIDYGKFPSHLVKVVTEGGSVYMMGLVTRNEGDAATEIASGTSGVLGVVKVFEYISPEEASRLDNHPASEAAKAPVR